MGEVTLKVPAEYVESFRLAVLAEVHNGGEWVGASTEDLSRECATSDEPSKVNPGDVHGSLRSLTEDVEIMDQLLGVDGNNEVAVVGDASALAHVAEAMARQVIAPRIASEVEVGPFDNDIAKSMDALTAALGWAAGESARLHEVAGIELKRAKAVAA